MSKEWSRRFTYGVFFLIFNPAAFKFVRDNLLNFNWDLSFYKRTFILISQWLCIDPAEFKSLALTLQCSAVQWNTREGTLYVADEGGLIKQAFGPHLDQSCSWNDQQTLYVAIARVPNLRWLHTARLSKSLPGPGAFDTGVAESPI